ncbi:MAG: hypothetical protein BRD42_07195 [Bacteroidetes bacterium QS_3_64_15]|nr:MAG: hypothetical protein BRD42_07195 [Bacteroidetes bacterium QS_3_64_15]
MVAWSTFRHVSWLPVFELLPMNARSIMHLVDMRLKPDAQWEIRELAEDVLEECSEWMPVAFDLYRDQHPNKLTP